MSNMLFISNWQLRLHFVIAGLGGFVLEISRAEETPCDTESGPIVMNQFLLITKLCTLSSPTMDHRKPYSRQQKICWCTETCGKLLTTQTRKKHYEALTPEEHQNKRDSESEPSESESFNSESEEEPPPTGSSCQHGIPDEYDKTFVLSGSLES
jgi:hypothetical protein